MAVTGTNSENKNMKLQVKELEVNGQPISGGGSAVAWAEVTGKPATFAPTIGTTASTALAGNTALLAIGTTASTAKAGNYTPTSAEVSTALKAKAQIAALVSPTADYADLTAVTAAIKTVIDALKA